MLGVETSEEISDYWDGLGEVIVMSKTDEGVETADEVISMRKIDGFEDVSF